MYWVREDAAMPHQACQKKLRLAIAGLDFKHLSQALLGPTMVAMPRRYQAIVQPDLRMTYMHLMVR